MNFSSEGVNDSKVVQGTVTADTIPPKGAENGIYRDFYIKKFNNITSETPVPTT
jgi:hypothetical protein